MGSVYRRGTKYWIQYYQGGKPIRESSHSEDKRDATKLLTIREYDIQQGKFPERIRKINLSEILSDLETFYHNNNLRSLRRLQISRQHLLHYFGDIPLKSLNGSLIGGYINHRKLQGKKGGTINRELSALKKALSLAKRNGKVAVIPYIGKLAESNPREGFIENDDYIRLLKALPPHLHLPLSLGFNVGMRKGEILSLEKSQVDLATMSIRLTPAQCKNKTGRTVPLLGDLQERVLAALADGNGFLCNHNGKRLIDFRRSWLMATQEVGLKGLLFHDLRRSAVRNMVRADIPEIIAMSITGHKTRSIFDRYDIVSGKDLEDAKRKMDIYLEKHKTTTIDSNNQKSTDDPKLYSNNNASLDLTELLRQQITLDSVSTWYC